METEWEGLLSGGWVEGVWDAGCESGAWRRGWDREWREAYAGDVCLVFQ